MTTTGRKATGVKRKNALSIKLNDAEYAAVIAAADAAGLTPSAWVRMNVIAAARARGFGAPQPPSVAVDGDGMKTVIIGGDGGEAAGRREDEVLCRLV